MANGFCKVCGTSVTGKKEYCDECYEVHKRERNRNYDRNRRRQMRLEKAELKEKAERKSSPPLLSTTEICLYAKERKITYGKAVQELEMSSGRRL